MLSHVYLIFQETFISSETVPRQQENILKFVITLDRIHSSKFCLCCYKVHTFRNQMAVKMENGFKKLT
jgi:hypothetical protein